MASLGRPTLVRNTEGMMTITMTDPSRESWIGSSPHRSSGIDVIKLVEREAKLGGFELSLTRFDPGYFSPIHRHNFEQIRIGVAGKTNYGKRVLEPRVVSYSPAGTRYGPQTVEAPSVQAILQYDGLGTYSHANQLRLKEAMARLSGKGTFEKGYFRPADGGPAQDAGEAVFEEATGRKIVYPEPRYAETIYMYVDGFPWQSRENSPVRWKKLGAFGWPETTIEMLSIPEGESVTLGDDGGPLIAFVLEGQIECNSGLLGKSSAALMEEHDRSAVTAKEAGTELVLIHLPHFQEEEAETREEATALA